MPQIHVNSGDLISENSVIKPLLLFKLTRSQFPTDIECSMVLSSIFFIKQKFDVRFLMGASNNLILLVKMKNGFNERSRCLTYLKMKIELGGLMKPVAIGCGKIKVESLAL